MEERLHGHNGVGHVTGAHTDIPTITSTFCPSVFTWSVKRSMAAEKASGFFRRGQMSLKKVENKIETKLKFHFYASSELRELHLRKYQINYIILIKLIKYTI